MTDLLAARSQMAMSLAFHIVFACAGMGMPLLMVIAESLWVKTGDEMYRTLAQKWAKGTAILFAVGAVSGTVLSFELGLLWPHFMAFAGPIIGMPFSLEGFAFFTEAIFLGIYLYGWDRVSPRAHLASGVMVALSGLASGMFVVTANAWMNTPAGFELDAAGNVVAVDPIAAMFNPSAVGHSVHMAIAAFMALAWGVAGIHAWMLRKDPRNRFHRQALGIALAVGTVTALLQPLSGHVVGEHVAHHQPAKLAAMEAHWETERGAGFTIGGWPDVEAEETHYALTIPGLLSFVSYGDWDAEVKGLKDFPEDERPPVVIVHLAHQTMVGIGMTLIGVGLLGALLALRARGVPDDPRYLALVAACLPLGFVAVEAGWVVTEVGRQPWTIYGILKTADAVTPTEGLIVPFLAFSALYVLLSIATVYLMLRQFAHAPSTEVADAAG
ncbi:MAG: cytochrome ubiquinol oxidase subunit I [Deltaproteobacteria bacterium]|nr:MAG: cytochrome ubiquinol oxidase subunit I [Deltaproteobacteria bacterium]